MSTLHLLSTLVLVILAAGLGLRHKSRSWHRALMAGAFAIDLALVLYIEVTREAVEKVVGGVSPIVIVHASISTVVILLYLGMLALGWNLFRGQERTRAFHRNLGIAFVVFRVASYSTSFYVTPSGESTIVHAEAPAQSGLTSTRTE